MASAVAVDSISGTTAFGGPCCDWSTFTRLSTPRIEAHAFPRCVVIGLQSTGEASTTLAREEAEGADEEMDDFISAPKMILYRLVKVRPRDSVLEDEDRSSYEVRPLGTAIGSDTLSSVPEACFLPSQINMFKFKSGTEFNAGEVRKLQALVCGGCGVRSSWDVRSGPRSRTRGSRQRESKLTPDNGSLPSSPPPYLEPPPYILNLQVYSAFKEWKKLPTCEEESKTREAAEARFRCVRSWSTTMLSS